GLHVERLLAGAGAALVAGHHELADLLAKAGVDLGGGEALELGFDVDRRLAAPGAPLVAGRQQLADLLVALPSRHRGGRSSAAAGVATAVVVLADRQASAADLVVELARREEGEHGHDRAADDH